jgi:uncharacterized YigZ family protein
MGAMTQLRTVLDGPDGPAHASFVERKSEFVSDACHVDSLEDAVAFVERVRQMHPKARHVAYAAICGCSSGRFAERMSDDGEPSGTAGKPILDMLRSRAITDGVITVTRYFGGILLGAGGLTRAYSSAAARCLDAARTAWIVPCRRFRTIVRYPQLRTLERLAELCGGRCCDECYTDKVELTLIVPQREVPAFVERVTQAFRNTLRLVDEGAANEAVEPGRFGNAGHEG